MSDEALPQSAAPVRRRRRAHARRLVGRVVAFGFFVLVAWLVIHHAREVDWTAVRAAVAAYPWTVLGTATALALASHLVYGTYELVSRRYVGHAVPAPKAVAVGMVSYAFNLNLGSLVGGMGFRWRLYSRLGLRQGQIGRIIAFSIATNWSGYLLLAGVALALRVIELPQPLAVGNRLLQALGVAMAALPLAYIAWCARARRRHFHVRAYHFRLPSGRLAAAQVALSALNWALIGSVIWVLMPEGVPYLLALATLLAAGIAGVITHIPAGLGVIEAVFVAVLAAQAPKDALIAALLVYRALYYLMPLAFAAALYLALEALAQRRGAPRG